MSNHFPLNLINIEKKNERKYQIIHKFNHSSFIINLSP
jgi:hypothetical protein